MTGRPIHEEITRRISRRSGWGTRTENYLPGWSYGLGILNMPLSCGGEAWGQGGDIDGDETRNGATDDGRAVTITVTALPTSEEAAMRPINALDQTLCAF
ncbi:hypothetical protein [Herbidospora cretacea]|uniref:hypothetical protein n=1 Tax=Herbidospora cretacea TaxID=28444 RepID=UPI0018CC5D65|nr:hypothetical protein [Herbidospora cretacea]